MPRMHIGAMARVFAQTSMSRCYRICVLLAWNAAASAQNECDSFLKSISPPAFKLRAKNFMRFRNRTLAKPVFQPERRVWDLIIFGYELEILQLHMRVLHPHVAGFLVSEASIEHQINRSKPTILSDALANEATLPQYMRDKTTVTVLGRADIAGCGRSVLLGSDGKVFSDFCFEGLQRFATLRLLFARAGPDDLAISADVDEIARPDVLNALVRCHPYGPTASRLEEAGGLVLQAQWMRYGLHCDGGSTWKYGPKLFAVRWLRRPENGWMSAFINASEKQFHHAASAFSELRYSGAYTMPIVARGGWHFTSFGGPGAVARKLNSFMHANLFTAYNYAYVPACLELCMGFLDKNKQAVDCREFLNQTNTAKVPATSASRRIRARGIHTQRRIGWQELERLATESEVPPILLTHRAEFPQSWYAFLTPHEN